LSGLANVRVRDRLQVQKLGGRPQATLVERRSRTPNGFVEIARWNCLPPGHKLTRIVSSSGARRRGHGGPVPFFWGWNAFLFSTREIALIRQLLAVGSDPLRSGRGRSPAPLFGVRLLTFSRGLVRTPSADSHAGLVGVGSHYEWLGPISTRPRKYTPLHLQMGKQNRLRASARTNQGRATAPVQLGGSPVAGPGLLAALDHDLLRSLPAGHCGRFVSSAPEDD